jgi:hypothetical protein
LLVQQRDVLKHPAIERGAINLDAALFHHFLKLTIADRVRHAPPDAPQANFPFKMPAKCPPLKSTITRSR